MVTPYLSFLFYQRSATNKEHDSEGVTYGSPTSLSQFISYSLSLHFSMQKLCRSCSSCQAPIQSISQRGSDEPSRLSTNCHSISSSAYVLIVETYQARHLLLRMTNVGIRRLWLMPRYISFGADHLLVMIDQVGLWRASAQEPYLSVGEVGVTHV